MKKTAFTKNVNSMIRLTFLIAICWLFTQSVRGQNINFSTEYDKIIWPTTLGVGGGLTGDDGNGKRLTLFHGNSISLQTGSNTPNIGQSRVYIDASGNVGIGPTTPLARLHVTGGGLVLGSHALNHNTDGFLSLGDITTSSSPTVHNWPSATTMLLNGLDYTTIGFHDSDSRVDFIRSGNGTIQLGYDGGWGPANIGLPNGIWRATGQVGIGTASLDALASLHVNGADVLSSGSTSGFRFRDRQAVPRPDPVYDDWIWYATDNVARFHRPGYGDILNVTAAGNVGIGTTSPINRLDVRGGATSVDYLQVNPQDNTVEGGEIQLQGAANNPAWKMDVYGTALRFHSNGAVPLFVSNELISIPGSVGIGTGNPGSYKLAVEGKIGAREVEVKIGNWADFVFQPGYRLRPLTEVASFINQHQHLPEIPSEADVKAAGISLGEMNAKLLQKIEELTLYVIDQQKQIDQLKPLLLQKDKVR